MNNNPNHIDHELLIKYLSGDTTREEMDSVEEWIEASTEHRKEYEALKMLWYKSAEVSDFDVIDSDADWRKVKSKISFEDEKVIPLYLNKGRSFYYYFSRIAAVLVLVSGIVLAVSRFKENKEMEPVIAFTGATEEKEILLPDGSKIYLNANSRISYHEDFEQKREVQLVGEAFFEVVKKEGFSFKVIAGNTVTEVLGTTFNVKTFEKQNRAVVTLMTGKVAFYKQNESKERVLMQKGEQAVYENGKIKKQLTEDKNVISWKENKLTFEDTKMAEVVKSLENYFNIKVEVSNDNLLNCRYTGGFNEPDADKTIEIVSSTLGASIEKRGNVYLIAGEGCEE